MTQLMERAAASKAVNRTAPVGGAASGSTANFMEMLQKQKQLAAGTVAASGDAKTGRGSQRRASLDTLFQSSSALQAAVAAKAAAEEAVQEAGELKEEDEDGDEDENGGSDDDETRNEARRAELLGPGASSSSSSPPSSFGPAVPPAMRPAGPPPASLRGLAPRTAEEVSTQRALQETLAADLAGLARRLRTNAEAAGAAVAERERLLRAAEGALDGAVDGAKRSVAEVKAVYFV